jgi:hypothetical protein
MNIIYSNYDIDIEDYRAEYPDMTDDQLHEIAVEYNAERQNLSIELPENIIAFASIGLWNGRVQGYKELSGNVKDIFSVFPSCDYVEYYVENGNVKGKGCHHDGTNFCTFRMWKAGINDAQKERVLTAVYNQQPADELIKRYTRSIAPAVKKVYGW